MTMEQYVTETQASLNTTEDGFTPERAAAAGVIGAKEFMVEFDRVFYCSTFHSYDIALKVAINHLQSCLNENDL